MKWAPRRNYSYAALVIALIPGLWLGLGWSLNRISFPVTLLSTPRGDCWFSNLGFSLKWRHSVEKEWWIENYQRNSSAFNLTSTQFKTFGAGTPDSGKLLTAAENSGWVSYQLNLSLAEINRNVSKLAELELILDNNQTLALSLWLPDYSAVNLKIKNIPLTAYFNSQSCYEP